MKKDAGLKSNFHTHTFRCGHAKGDIKDYTKSAISFGFKNIGFSDHAFFPGIHHEFMRGDFSLLDDYIKAFQKTKKKYGKKINMYLGFEAEYMENFDSYYDDLLNKYGFDYLILGQHLKYDENGKLDLYFNANKLNDIENIKRYKDDLINGMKSGKFLYVCHPDLFIMYVNNINDEIIEIINEIVDASIKYDVPLEVNLGGLRWNTYFALNRGAFSYPNFTFWDIVSKKKAKAVIGLDAHDPHDLSNSLKFVLDDFLKKHDLNIVDPLDVYLSYKIKQEKEKKY